MSKKVPLQNDMFAIVDDEDYDRTNKYNWHAYLGGTNTDLSVARNDWSTGENKRQRLSYFILNQDLEKGKSIIYKNNNKLDNRKENL